MSIHTNQTNEIRMIKMNIELKQDMLNDVTDYIFLSGKSDVETLMFVLELCNNLGIDVEGTLKLNEHKVEVLNLTDVEIHKGKKD